MNRNDQLKAARLWGHDIICSAECVSRKDHSRDRFHRFAADYVDAHDDIDRGIALHALMCLPYLRGTCTVTDIHLDNAIRTWMPQVDDVIGRQP